MPVTWCTLTSLRPTVPFPRPTVLSHPSPHHPTIPGTGPQQHTPAEQKEPGARAEVQAHPTLSLISLLHYNFLLASLPRCLEVGEGCNRWRANEVTDYTGACLQELTGWEADTNMKSTRELQP